MPTLHECPVPKQEWLNRAHGRNSNPAAPASQDHSRKAEDRTEADRWEVIIDELVAMQHLGDDWDGLGAAAPSRELLTSAIGLAYTLLERNVEPPSCVVPSTAGTVVLIWQFKDSAYADIEIDLPFHADVMLVEPGKPPKHWELPTD